MKYFLLSIVVLLCCHQQHTHAFNHTTIKTDKQTEKTALIIGVTGQDGGYVSEFLLNKGYIVHGLKRRSSSMNTGRIDHLLTNPILQHQVLPL